MSVSKPFVFALVCEALGPERARERLGVNGTGLPFNSRQAVERSRDGRTNPMVNSGRDRDDEPRPGRRRRGASGRSPRRPLALRRPRPRARRGGLPLGVGDEPAQPRHRAPARRATAGSTATRPRRSTSTRGSARSSVTAHDLAVMGATLADGGVNPLTRERVVDADGCRYTLAVMTTAGLYETSGDWLYDVGLPGQERDRRRHRHRLARQGRPRDVRAAARRGRQQRQGAARGALPLAPARPRPASPRRPEA